MQRLPPMTRIPRPLRLALPVCVFALAVPAFAADPVDWPEDQRSFFEDGPAWLLTAAERGELAAASEAERGARIAALLAEDPDPATEVNELALGIRHRLELARSLFTTPSDARYRVAFLHGLPTERTIIDCGQTFKPMEVWAYDLSTAGGARASALQTALTQNVEPPKGGLKNLLHFKSDWTEEPKLVFYRTDPSTAFRLWNPLDGKRPLYTRGMDYLLQQYDELRNLITGKRFDLQACDTTRVVDAATGIGGLAEFYLGRPKEGPVKSFLEPPADRAAWAREASKTTLEGKAELPLSRVEAKFPLRQGDLIVSRLLIEVASSEGLETTLDGDVELIVDALIESGGSLLTERRARFRTAPPQAAAPLTLALEENLRAGVPVVARFHVKDEISGREGWIVKAFRVPAQPIEADRETSVEGAAVLGEKLALAASAAARDGLILAPPVEGQVSLGLWRAQALVSGARIQKVVFLVDGVEQVSRKEEPWEAELRLATYPAEQIVRAEGYDAGGELVAADEVILNQPRGSFKVRILEPRRGAKVVSETTARAEVVVPEDRTVTGVEFKVNDHVVASLEKPPWTAVVRPGGAGETTYVSVTATLDDGRTAEDVRFLNSPDIVEEVDVRLVELYTTVADRTGRLQLGLGEDDFEILEDGRPQQISKFELVENLPLTIGIAIDTSGSMQSALSEAQLAGQAFLANVTRPKDRCFVVAFSGKPTLLMPPTDDVGGCQQGLDGLQAVGWTALHDAIVTSLYYMRELEGQRALVLLSDGDDTTSSIAWKDALEYAKRSGAVVYTVGLGVGELDLGIRHKLSDLAAETGGRTFYVKRAEELSGIYGEIERELRSRYLLAYAPDRSDETGAFHQIEVKLKKGGLKARTIRGYYR